MVNSKNVGKRESMLRAILGGILIVLSFLFSGIFWLGVGLVGVIVVVTAFFKY